MLQQAGLANVIGAPMSSPMAGMPPSGPGGNQMGSQAPSQQQDGTARYCSVALPDKQPMAARDSQIARRVFIVSHPERFTDDVLRDAFCRFGNLIDAYFVPGKSIIKMASSYIAQYPVVRTVQGALHFSSLAALFNQTPFRLLWESMLKVPGSVFVSD